MVLAVFPCPPLPLIGLQNRAGDECDLLVGTDFSSHDLIAQFMQLAMRLGTDDQHAQRRIQQTECLQRYITSMQGVIDPDTMVCDVPRAYEAMCTYTRDHIMSYVQWCCNANASMDIRFIPYQNVCTGDTVQMRTVDHARAQARLYRTQHETTASEPAAETCMPQPFWDYPTLLTEYAINIYNS